MANHVAELWAVGQNPGPTGRFVEVTQGSVQDAGDNILFEGAPNLCLVKRNHYLRYGTPCRLVPREWRPHTEAISGGEILWQCITQESSPTKEM